MRRMLHGIRLKTVTRTGLVEKIARKVFGCGCGMQWIILLLNAVKELCVGHVWNLKVRKKGKCFCTLDVFCIWRLESCPSHAFIEEKPNRLCHKDIILTLVLSTLHTCHELRPNHGSICSNVAFQCISLQFQEMFPLLSFFSFFKLIGWLVMSGLNEWTVPQATNSISWLVYNTSGCSVNTRILVPLLLVQYGSWWKSSLNVNIDLYTLYIFVNLWLSVLHYIDYTN